MTLLQPRLQKVGPSGLKTGKGPEHKQMKKIRQDSTKCPKRLKLDILFGGDGCPGKGLCYQFSAGYLFSIDGRMRD